MTILQLRDFGVNPEIQLNQRVIVTKVYIDGDNETVSVYIKVQTLSPNGVVVGEGEEKKYVRYNRPEKTNPSGEVIAPSNNKFNQLFESEAGVIIRNILDSDLSEINSIDTIEKDLEQL